MANEQKIKFATVATVEGTNLFATSFSKTNYPDSGSMPNQKQEEPDLYEAEITDVVKTTNAITVLEGILITALDINLIDIEIDINGNLLILSDKALQYALNNNGELEYTFII